MPILEIICQRAMLLMKNRGFPVAGPVNVALDPALPFMGYTTESGGKPLIVVSGMAVSSGYLLGLLVHELSHVFRTQTNHPSHNYILVNRTINFVLEKKIFLPYQIEIIHNIINHLQDLYADDISLAVFKPENLNEFFLGWVGGEIGEETEDEKKWLEAAGLLSTSFAQANLERHKIPDRGKRVTEAVGKFLLRTDKNLAREYQRFEKMMVNLPEKISEENYGYLLKDYLNSFLKLAS